MQCSNANLVYQNIVKVLLLLEVNIHTLHFLSVSEFQVLYILNTWTI